MKAFKGKVNKDQFIKEIKWHMEQDAFLQGTYIEDNKNNFRGCAVGCSINSINRLLGTSYNYDEHIDMVETLQIPEWLVRLEDKIFEGLSEKDSKEWPLRFSEAINVGADLDKIKPEFLVYVLESIPGTHEFVHRAIALWKRDDLYSDAWKKESCAVYNDAADAANAANAANAATANATANAYAAFATAYAAYAAYAADAAAAFANANANAYANAAADTANATAYAANAANAVSAVSAAAYAANANADAANAVRAANACANAADARAEKRGEIYKKFSDKLIELMKNCED